MVASKKSLVGKLFEVLEELLNEEKALELLASLPHDDGDIDETPPAPPPPESAAPPAPAAPLRLPGDTVLLVVDGDGEAHLFDEDEIRVARALVRLEHLRAAGSVRIRRYGLLDDIVPTYPETAEAALAELMAERGLAPETLAQIVRQMQ